MSSHSPEPPNLRRPHPLAEALIERLGRGLPMRVLELGAGGGRNTKALRAAGFDVEAIPDDGLHSPLPAHQRFDAALSTHGFLHGTPQTVRALLLETAQRLGDGAPAYLTFASTQDSRFGKGQRIDERTYAQPDGDEAGVPHVFFDEGNLRQLLGANFEVDALEELDVDAVAGRWAHEKPTVGAVHWFARLRKRT